VTATQTEPHDAAVRGESRDGLSLRGIAQLLNCEEAFQGRALDGDHRGGAAFLVLYCGVYPLIPPISAAGVFRPFDGA
jgi:hypothetical protein